MKTVKMLRKGFKVRNNVVSCTIITTFPESEIRESNRMATTYLHIGRLENIMYPVRMLDYEKKLIVVTATAKCSKNDTFNLNYGKMLASMKAEQKLAKMHKRVTACIKDCMADTISRIDSIQMAAKDTNHNLTATLENILKPEYVADFIAKDAIRTKKEAEEKDHEEENN